MLAGLNAGGVDGAVRLVPDVEDHDRSIVTTHRQKGVVHRVEVETHDLFLRRLDQQGLSWHPSFVSLE